MHRILKKDQILTTPNLLSLIRLLMIPLIITFAIRELFMVIMGYITIKKQNLVISAQWYGKVTTIVLYTVMMVLILFPKIPEVTANCMILFCGAVMIVTFVLYARFYVTVWREDEGIADCNKQDINRSHKLD